MDSLKDTIRDMQEIIQHLEAENKELKDTTKRSAKALAMAIGGLEVIKKETGLRAVGYMIKDIEFAFKKHSTNTAPLSEEK